MSVLDWAEESFYRIRKDGMWGVSESVSELRAGYLRRVTDVHPNATPIWDKEWDVLVLIDACRADLFAEVSDEFDFVRGDWERTHTISSSTPEWLNKNFSEVYSGQCVQTAYITASPHSDNYCDGADFEYLDEVWRRGFDDELGTIPADAVTEAAASYRRRNPSTPLIVHYLQPHHPFVPQPMDEGITLSQEERARSVWSRLRDGEVDCDSAWSAYRENLRYVLESVEVLLDNCNAETVAITSDHGNALGERNIYGHPTDIHIDCLTEVPWVETTAEDRGALDVAIDDHDVEASVSEQLESLGYK